MGYPGVPFKVRSFGPTSTSRPLARLCLFLCLGPSCALHLDVSARIWRSHRPGAVQAAGVLESDRDFGLMAAQRCAALLSKEISEALRDWPPLVRRAMVPAAGPDDHLRGDKQSKKCLSILQWNVLSDGLSGSHPDRGGFVRAPPDSLEWDKRRWRILEEILRWDCDILTLQEVDHHDDWLAPKLRSLGYRGLFVKKPNPPGLEYGEGLEDGCSLFWKASECLQLLDARCFTYCVAESAERPHERVIQNQVALISVFRVVAPGLPGPGVGGGGGDAHLPPQEGHGNNNESSARAVEAVAVPPVPPAPTDPGRRDVSQGKGEGDVMAVAEGVRGESSGCSYVVVATTHLKASKSEEGEWVRSQQVAQLLREVHRFRANAAAAQGVRPEDVALLVTGDFNAMPHATGGPEGYAPACLDQVRGHPLGLQSAYDLNDGATFTTWKIRPRKPLWGSGAAAAAAAASASVAVAAAAPGGEPGATSGTGGGGGGGGRDPAAEGAAEPQETVTSEVKSCIDYVWLSPGVEVLSRAGMPSGEELGEARAPSRVYPSDHFSLVARLRLL